MSIDDITELPFVESKVGRLVNLWNAKESGVYALDNKAGRDHADAFIVHTRRRPNPTLLGNIVKSMVSHGVYGPIEVGFFHRLSEHSATALACARASAASIQEQPSLPVQ